MVIDGYMLKDTTDLIKVYDTLRDIKEKIHKISEREYYKFLGKEVAFLADKVVLGQIKKDMPIIDAAVSNVNRYITTAGAKGETTRYNLRVFVNILVYNGDTYLNVICANKALLGAFRPLEDISVSEEECADMQNKKTRLWQKLHSMFDNQPTINCDLSADILKTVEEIDRKKIKYPDVKERIHSQAVESVFNSKLSMLAHGESVNPLRLYSYIEEIFEELTTEDTRTLIRQKEKNLHMLIDFNKDDSALFVVGKEKGYDTDSNQTEQKP